MNVHPYGSYLWNKDDPTSDPNYKALIGGKGERANASWKKLVDKNAEAYFKNPKAYAAFLKSRKKFLEKK